MNFETQEQLDECLAKWQKILRLQDWQISAKVVRARDMPNEDEQARIMAILGNKQARITLRSADDWPPDSVEQHDHERSLVHELLHCYEMAISNRLPDKWITRTYYDREQLCECLAIAFVELARTKPVAESGILAMALPRNFTVSTNGHAAPIKSAVAQSQADGL